MTTTENKTPEEVAETEEQDQTKRHRTTWHPSPLQQNFIDYFDGDGPKTARLAGYSESSAVQASRLCLQNENVVKAIKERGARKEPPPLKLSAKEKKKLHIHNREQRQQFWSLIMDDTSIPINYRLKASELLGKSEGDFIDRVQVSGTVLVDRAERLGRARRKVLAGPYVDIESSKDLGSVESESEEGENQEYEKDREDQEYD